MAASTEARQESQWWGYSGAATMLLLAFLFPVGLMIFNPTLMFARGWEQYVGTAIYFWAVLTLTRELLRLWKNERSFQDGPRLLKRLTSGASGGGAGDAKEPRALAERKATPGRSGSDGSDAGSARDDAVPGILSDRIRQLAGCLKESSRPSVTQLMDVNRESSGLDQEQMAGRFTLTRYILYLLPVIGFIGTVEGISRALMNISKVLPMVKNLDGFLTNLTSVTAALQIAFDSTLLALFLSAALMLVQTLVHRRAEDLLARVDRWVVDQLLPKVGTDDPMTSRLIEVIGPYLDELGKKLAFVIEPAARSLHEQAEKLGESLRGPITHFASGVERLPEALASFREGADAIGRVGNDLEAIGSASESLSRSSTSLSRIELVLSQWPSSDPRLGEIQRGIERTGTAIESLAGSWSAAYERSSRATQEQLAHSLTNLKDALELLNVSMEQGNALYRSIVKKLFEERADAGPHRGDSIRVA
jgi:biopolymer transport protein ExbB/TolQ